MYQFYYADNSRISGTAKYNRSINSEYDVTAIRPTMWEEHCLECSAPLCFKNCLHYEARSDGRCKRFANGISISENELGCCGQAARLKFRKWANMMTIVFPAMLPMSKYISMINKNQKLGKRLGKITDSHLPVNLKWQSIRTVEYLRRRKLRNLSGISNQPDAFVFHGYSFEKDQFNLIIEVFDDHTPVFKTAINMMPGENLTILDKSKLGDACHIKDYLVKVYPENDLEAEIEILWCDFVQGTPKSSEVPASTVKCVVWDLDNTIWNGILIETDNPDTLELNPGVLDMIKAFDERGIIQSIASKNDFDLAWPVVERLGLADYFIYPQIHWNAKSASIDSIAKSLNIGIDTFALIDDSVFERNQVNSVWPQVRTYDVTELSNLLSKNEFSVMITEESKNRRAMYKAEEKRNQLMFSDNADTVEFLKKSNLQITIFAPKDESEILRSYELVVRTNQLNMSGMKYTKEEFDVVLKRSDHKNFAFSCKDDFGSYGIVGFGQYKIENNSIVFTEFAMSCRVAGKYVESALFNALLERETCDKGYFTVKKTKKNILLRRTLQDIGFRIMSETDNCVRYVYSRSLKMLEIGIRVFVNN